MNLESLPRFPLANLPTHLDYAPRLSRELELEVWFKRDDLTGFALGGNKVRKLEFLLADALAQGATRLVTGGGPQSNHTRITAAAARKAGLDVTLLLFGNPPTEENGNLLLDRLLGADVTFTGQGLWDNETLIEKATQDLVAQGQKAYRIPAGGSSILGCISYMLAVRELFDQLREHRLEPDSIVVTTGSCGTHAGILAGLKYQNSQIPVHGITVSRPVAEGQARITRLVRETAEFLNRPISLDPSDIIIHGEYLGPGYAKITPEARHAIERVAQLEGVFLDPVYTGKAMAGLFDLAQRKTLPRGSTVVFWHTGGIPGLFGHADDFK